MAIVLALWNKKSQFPIDFVALEGFTDETDQYLQSLNNLTPIVHDVFLHLATNSILHFYLFSHIDHYLMEKDLKDFLISAGIRGLMTMLGFRKTTGS